MALSCIETLLKINNLLTSEEYTCYHLYFECEIELEDLIDNMTSSNPNLMRQFLNHLILKIDIVKCDKDKNCRKFRSKLLTQLLPSSDIPITRQQVERYILIYDKFQKDKDYMVLIDYASRACETEGCSKQGMKLLRNLVEKILYFKGLSKGEINRIVEIVNKHKLQLDKKKIKKRIDELKTAGIDKNDITSNLTRYCLTSERESIKAKSESTDELLLSRLTRKEVEKENKSTVANDDDFEVTEKVKKKGVVSKRN